MGRPSIVVVGSANTDLTILTEYLPGPGETVLGGELIQAGGGKGANQAVAAARAGAQVAFVGRLGDDAFGEATLDNLRREGINTDGVVVDEEAATGVALIVVDGNGENLIAVAPGANARVSPADVRAAEGLMAGADLLLVQLEIPLDAVLAALAVAREHGVSAMLNPAPSPRRELPGELLADLDYLVPNSGEARRLVGAPEGESPEMMARELARAGARVVVMTLGAEGACVCEGQECVRITPPPVSVVDTVGAGDCFCGVLAVALGEGLRLREAAEFATCAAALSVQKAGAQPSLPHRRAIEELFNQRRQAQERQHG